jgi:hypothetical protein
MGIFRWALASIESDEDLEVLLKKVIILQNLAKEKNRSLRRRRRPARGATIEGAFHYQPSLAHLKNTVTAICSVPQKNVNGSCWPELIAQRTHCQVYLCTISRGSALRPYTINDF